MKIMKNVYYENREEKFDSLAGMPIGMGYVPMQEWRDVFEAGKGLEEATIFAELVLPFYGEKAACNPMFSQPQHQQHRHNNRMRDCDMHEGEMQEGGCNR